MLAQRLEQPRAMSRKVAEEINSGTPSTFRDKPAESREQPRQRQETSRPQPGNMTNGFKARGPHVDNAQKQGQITGNGPKPRKIRTLTNRNEKKSQMQQSKCRCLTNTSLERHLARARIEKSRQEKARFSKANATHRQTPASKKTQTGR